MPRSPDEHLLREGVVTLAQQTDGAAILRCDAAAKQALIRALVAANLDIGTVQAMRAATLEETYMKHAGVTA